MLGGILRAIIELNGTTYWPELSVMLWAILEKYREELRPELVVLYPDREDVCKEQECSQIG